jgi:hypothetical protein
MELVREAVETVILTGRLVGHAPVSLLLVASPESGKTSVVLEKDCQGILALTDVTGRGLQELCRQRAEVSHFVLNDLIAVGAHKASVSRYTFSMLNAMTEEGISATATPGGFEKYTGGRRGIIASVPTSIAKDGRNWWNKIGLTSRMLPLAFKHSIDLNLRIKTAIVNGASQKNPKPKGEVLTFKIPAEPIRVYIPPVIASAVREVAEAVSAKFKEEGYRRVKQFLALASAHVLLRTWKNPRVGKGDVEFLRKLAPYVSYTTPREI